jgi:hypothetical protein
VLPKALRSPLLTRTGVLSSTDREGNRAASAANAVVVGPRELSFESPLGHRVIKEGDCNSGW